MTEYRKEPDYIKRLLNRYPRKEVIEVKEEVGGRVEVIGYLVELTYAVYYTKEDYEALKRIRKR